MNPQLRTIRDADAEKKRVKPFNVAFSSGEGKDRGVLRMAGGEAENAERRERESDVEKNRMEEPFEEAAPNAGQYMRRKEAGCICTMTPSFAWLGMHSAANVNLPIHCTKKGTKRGENSSR